MRLAPPLPGAIAAPRPQAAALSRDRRGARGPPQPLRFSFRLFPTSRGPRPPPPGSVGADEAGLPKKRRPLLKRLKGRTGGALFPPPCRARHGGKGRAAVRGGTRPSLLPSFKMGKLKKRRLCAEPAGTKQGKQAYTVVSPTDDGVRRMGTARCGAPRFAPAFPGDEGQSNQ